jgi:hypothetical protein
MFKGHGIKLGDMEFYQIMVLVHVLGSFGIFTGWGMEIAAAQRLTTTDTAVSLREILKAYSRASRLSMISMAVTFSAGIYLMVTAWGPQAWITTAVVTLLFLITTGIYYSRKALPMLKIMSQEEYQFFMTAYSIRVRFLIVSLRIRIASGATILALMVLKPAMTGTIALLLVLAFLISLLIFFPAGKKKPGITD